MSAEKLREAASEIRDDYSAESMGMPTPDPFMYAVADWLEWLAPFTGHDDDAFVVKHGIAVARAYLNEVPS